MSVPVLTFRRCLLLGLLLLSLVKLADGMARYELRRAAGEITLAAAAVNGGSAATTDE